MRTRNVSAKIVPMPSHNHRRQPCDDTSLSQESSLNRNTSLYVISESVPLNTAPLFQLGQSDNSSENIFSNNSMSSPMPTFPLSTSTPNEIDVANLGQATAMSATMSSSINEESYVLYDKIPQRSSTDDCYNSPASCNSYCKNQSLHVFHPSHSDPYNLTDSSSTQAFPGPGDAKSTSITNSTPDFDIPVLIDPYNNEDSSEEDEDTASGDPSTAPWKYAHNMRTDPTNISDTGNGQSLSNSTIDGNDNRNNNYDPASDYRGSPTEPPQTEEAQHSRAHMEGI